MSETIFIYDTTLRDGTQREGLSLSVNDKLNVARRLDEFGVHEHSDNKVALLGQINRFLLEAYSENKKIILVIINCLGKYCYAVARFGTCSKPAACCHY